MEENRRSHSEGNRRKEKPFFDPKGDGFQRFNTYEGNKCSS